MGQRTSEGSALRFAAYVEELVGVIGHSDRAGSLRDYCTDLMLPFERKSVEPMAAVTAPERTAVQHQSLLHFIGNARWSRLSLRICSCISMTASRRSIHCRAALSAADWENASPS